MTSSQVVLTPRTISARSPADRGAFVLDCVGVNATLATGVAVLSWRGRLAMVGAGGGSFPSTFSKRPQVRNW
jgi:threonine dehydrogenase-like Zn-dependent dehydrogenase